MNSTMSLAYLAGENFRRIAGLPQVIDHQGSPVSDYPLVEVVQGEAKVAGAWKVNEATVAKFP